MAGRIAFTGEAHGAVSDWPLCSASIASAPVPVTRVTGA
jgi:hypothetical protein